MKKIFLISFILLFLFPFVSHSDWTKVSQTFDGAKYPATIYVDFERIRKGGGYVYFWPMMDYLEPLHGVLSDVMRSPSKYPTLFGMTVNDYSKTSPLWRRLSRKQQGIIAMWDAVLKMPRDVLSWHLVQNTQKKN